MQSIEKADIDKIIIMLLFIVLLQMLVLWRHVKKLTISMKLNVNFDNFIVTKSIAITVIFVIFTFPVIFLLLI